MELPTTKGTKQFQLNAAVLRAIPFGIYVVFLAVESTLSQGAQAFDVRALYAVKVSCVAIALGILWHRYSELQDVPKTSWRAWLASVIVGLAIFGIWIYLDQSWAVLGNPTGWNPLSPNGSVNWALVAVRIIGAALIVPVMEELFWRSLILRWIRNTDFLSVQPLHAGAMALLVSSTLFALEHHQWLAGLIAGLAYGGTYMLSRNLWCAIAAHATTNLMLGLWVVHTGQWQFW